LLAQGYAVRYNEFDGDHDYASWNRSLVDSLKWALPLSNAEGVASCRDT
jgi:enterochelin esterase-like enzyme